MLQFNFEKFKESIVKNKGSDKLEITKGMEYINEIISGDTIYTTKDVNYDRFTLEDLDQYRALVSNMEYLNEENNKLYKRIKGIKPKMISKVNYI